MDFRLYSSQFLGRSVWLIRYPAYFGVLAATNGSGRPYFIGTLRSFGPFFSWFIFIFSNFSFPAFYSILSLNLGLRPALPVFSFGSICPRWRRVFIFESTTRMCSIKYGILLDSGRSDAQFITNASGNSPWTCWYGHGWDTMEGIFICGVGDSFRTGDFQSDRWERQSTEYKTSRVRSITSFYFAKLLLRDGYTKRTWVINCIKPEGQKLVGNGIYANWGGQTLGWRIFRIQIRLFFSLFCVSRFICIWLSVY